MKNSTLILALTACLSMCSCEKLNLAGILGINGTCVNDRFESSKEYLRTNPVPDINVSSDTYRTYLVTDIHYNGEDDKLERFVSSCISDTESEKVVFCLGDIFDGRDRQKIVHDKLQPFEDAGWKFFNTPGNHDIYFQGWDEFSKYWPLSTYTVKVNTPGSGSDLFIFLDSAEGSFGAAQLDWAENLLKDSAGKYRNIVVLTHTNFFNTDNSQLTSGNYTLEETAKVTSIFSSYGVNYVLTGHDHYYELRRFKNVNYYTFNSLTGKSGSYYSLEISNGLRFEEKFISESPTLQ